MFEGIDWQPILIATIAIMSLINGLSVFQNFRTDRADVRVSPVYEDDWMYWTELADPDGSKEVRRYVVIGHMGRTNFGRRPASVVSTQLKIKLRNRKSATSPLYDVPPPELTIANAAAERLPVLKPEPDPFDFMPMLHPGQTKAGIHCFLFGMYGSELWTPIVENGILEGTMELESGFGKTFRSKLQFRHVKFAALQTLFPTLEKFVLNNLEAPEE
jgi:hypothetical protein